MTTIAIYRDDFVLIEVKPDDDSTQVKKVMGDNEVRINFTANTYYDFHIGDKALIFGEWYYLTTIPETTKLSSREYVYSLLLKSSASILERAQYQFLGNDNTLKEGEFSLTGKAIDFLNLIIQNAARLKPVFSFSAGEVIDTDYKTITFSGENCLTALAKIAESFETEFWIEGFRVSLTSVGRDTGYTFQQGMRKGMYELIRKPVDNQRVITRLYAFGSDKNLPENYRSYSKRLKLPGQPKKTITNLAWLITDNGDNTETYEFSWDAPDVVDATSIYVLSKRIGHNIGFVKSDEAPVGGTSSITLLKGDYVFKFMTVSPGGNFSTPEIEVNVSDQPAFPFAGEVLYLEKNIEKYGVSEGTIIFEDIYPHRTGTVTGVNAGDPTEFTDTGVDFDVNGYLLPGATAKVTFNTGMLSGYTFEIKSYDHGLKRFYLLQTKSERAIEVPSFDFKPAIGDKYVLTDIKMPQSYIDVAEAQLLTRSQRELELISEPQVSYNLVIDPVYLKEKKYTIALGDLIWIKDAVMGVQRKLRAISVQREVVNEFAYTIEVADALSDSKIGSLVSVQSSLLQSVQNINSDIRNNSINNNRVVGDLFMTKEATLVFENIPTGTISTTIGLDANGRLVKE